MEASAGGLASEYYAGFDTSPSSNIQHEAHVTTDNIEPPRPPRPTVQYSSPSASAYDAAPTGGLASDYYSGFYTSPTSNIQHEAHVPSAATDYSRPPRPPAQSSNSNGALDAAAAAGVTGEAGTYYLGHPHLSQDSYGGHGHQHSSGPQSSSMTMAHRPKRRGPLDKLVNFFRDPEAVGEFEEYTAAIGVCKHCFDPRSSPKDAPRRHHYKRRNSGGRHSSSTRVHKLYRQHSSDEEKRKSSSSKAPLIASGLAGYGVAKLGGTLLNNKDFDDTYSVRTGHPNGSQLSLGRAENRSHSRREKHSSRGDMADHRPSSQQNVGTKIGKHQTTGRMYEERRRRRRSSISSSSSHSRHALHKHNSTNTDIVASERQHRSRRKRSPSPKKPYYHKRVSPKHSYVDLSGTISGGGGIGSFFSSPSANRRKGKKSKGLFGFSNASSSSSDADLAFGEGSVRRKDSNRADYRKDNRNVDSAILGLAATGAALAAASSRKETKKRQNAELVAAKERRDHNSRVSGKRQSYPKKYSSSSEENSVWEDASDDDLSDNSALAYGASMSARRSRESLGSSDGTSKWDWRWNKRKQSKPIYGFKNEPSISPAAVGLAGIAIGSATSMYNRPVATGSSASLPPMQQLHPMPTSDPAVFDVAQQNSTVISPVTTIPPSITSSSVPLQQPRPVMPVSPAVYTTSSPTSAPIYRSASPSVIFPNARIDDVVTSKSESRRYSNQDGEGRRRRDSSPAHSSVSKDIPQVKPRRRASTRDQASIVKFDLTEEQSQRERRSQKPVDRRSRRSTDEGKRRRKSVDDEEHGKEQKGSPRSVGNNVEAPQPREDSVERRRAREREIERELERLYEEDRRQSSDRKTRHEDDSVQIAGVTAATTGMTPTAAIVKSMSAKDEGRRISEVSRERQSGDESQPRSTSNTVSEEDTAELERRSRRIAQRAAIRVKTTPIPIRHDDYATYFTPSELQEKLREHNEASERRHTPEPSSPLSPDVIDIAPKIGLSPVSPSSPTSAGFKFDPFHYIPFGIRAKDDPSAHPWPVPRLDLIEPTPPHSALSTKSDKSKETNGDDGRRSRERSETPRKKGKNMSKDKDIDEGAPARKRSRSGSRSAARHSERHLSDDEEFMSSEEAPARRLHDTHDTAAENEKLSFLGERPEMPTVSDGASGSKAESNLTRDEMAAQPITTIGGSQTSTSAHVAHPESSVSAAQESQESNGRDQDVTSTPQADHTRPRRPSGLRVAELTSSPVPTTSPTAVPIHFRRLPVSPGAARSASVSTPGVESGPSSPLVPRARQSRPGSTEFRSNEFRPLWLVERHASSKNDQAEIEQSYPSLPSSRTSSAHPSIENLRGSQDFEDVFEPEPESSPRFEHRRSSSHPHWHDERPKSPDFLDSRTATPTAVEFSREVKKEKPKYEFHSPSELLQDPATFHVQPETTNLQMSPMQLPRALASEPSDVESLPALPDSRPTSPVSVERQIDDDSVMQGSPSENVQDETGGFTIAKKDKKDKKTKLAVTKSEEMTSPITEQENAISSTSTTDVPIESPPENVQENIIPPTSTTDVPIESPPENVQENIIPLTSTTGVPSESLSENVQENVVPLTSTTGVPSESLSENVQENVVPLTSTTDVPTKSLSENVQENVIPLTSTTDVPTESPSKNVQGETWGSATAKKSKKDKKNKKARLAQRASTFEVPEVEPEVSPSPVTNALRSTPTPGAFDEEITDKPSPIDLAAEVGPVLAKVPDQLPNQKDEQDNNEWALPVLKGKKGKKGKKAKISNAAQTIELERNAQEPYELEREGDPPTMSGNKQDLQSLDDQVAVAGEAEQEAPQLAITVQSDREKEEIDEVLQIPTKKDEPDDEWAVSVKKGKKAKKGKKGKKGKISRPAETSELDKNIQELSEIKREGDSASMSDNKQDSQLLNDQVAMTEELLHEVPQLTTIAEPAREKEEIDKLVQTPIKNDEPDNDEWSVPLKKGKKAKKGKKSKIESPAKTSELDQNARESMEAEPQGGPAAISENKQDWMPIDDSIAPMKELVPEAPQDLIVVESATKNEEASPAETNELDQNARESKEAEPQEGSVVISENKLGLTPIDDKIAPTKELVPEAPQDPITGELDQNARASTEAEPQGGSAAISENKQDLTPTDEKGAPTKEVVPEAPHETIAVKSATKNEENGEFARVPNKKAKGKKNKKNRQQFSWEPEPEADAILDVSASSEQHPAATKSDATLPTTAGFSLTAAMTAAAVASEKSDRGSESRGNIPEVELVWEPKKEATISRRTDPSGEPDAEFLEAQSIHEPEKDVTISERIDLSGEPDPGFLEAESIREPEKEVTTSERTDPNREPVPEFFEAQSIREPEKDITISERIDLSGEPDPGSLETESIREPEKEVTTSEKTDLSEEPTRHFLGTESIQEHGREATISEPVVESNGQAQPVVEDVKLSEDIAATPPDLDESQDHALIGHEMEQLPGPRLIVEREAGEDVERNRDSGVQFMEEAAQPEDLSRAALRDSGYIPSPITRPGWDEAILHSVTERPHRPRTPTSSSEDVRRELQTFSTRSLDHQVTRETTADPGSPQEIERARMKLNTYEAERPRDPSPVDSTTKDRSSELFGSSPSYRSGSFINQSPSEIRHPANFSDDPPSPSSRPMNEARHNIQEHPEARQSNLGHEPPPTETSLGDGIPVEPYRSIFGPPASHDTMERLASPPRAPLQTIAEDEHEDEKSPTLGRKQIEPITISPPRNHSPLGHSRLPTPESQPAQKKVRRSDSSEDIRPTSFSSEHSEDREKAPSPSHELERSVSPKNHTPSGHSRLPTPEIQPAQKKVRRNHGSEDIRPTSFGSEHSEDHRRPPSPSHELDRSIPPMTPHSELITTAGAIGTAGLGAAVLQPQPRDISSDDTKSLGTPHLKSTTAKQRRRRQQGVEGLPSSSTYDPVIDKGKEVVRDMAEIYDGYGVVPGSPMSPTRPPSVRKRQSMQQIKDLEARLDQLLSENRLLATAKITAEKELEDYHNSQSRQEGASQEALSAREQALKKKDAELGKLQEAVEWMQNEVMKLTEVNEGLSSANQALATTHTQLESQHNEKQTQWQESTKLLETLKSQNDEKDLRWQESARELEMLRSQNPEKDVQWQESARELEMLRSQNNEKDLKWQESTRELEMLRSQNNEKDSKWQESARELEMLRSQNNEKDLQWQESARLLEMLRSQNSEKDVQWQESARELEMLRSQNNEKDVQLQELEALKLQHEQLSSGMEEIVRHEIETALAAKNAELRQLYSHLEVAKEKIRELQQQIIASKNDDIIPTRDEDYFDGACQQLCQHVQQWVLRFSKFSDTRICRSTNEVRDDQIVDRFENAIVDGSDVDIYLADRIKRRDVFMSVVMTIIWEFVFSRYLFGMDREQRQKLKQLEKQLLEVGPRSAVHRWRAITLTLLSRREAFASQRAKDTEAVAQEIFGTLARFLPPPQNLEKQILESLRNVMKLAVDLSIEMRTQRAEYIMLPPLQPEYDLTGDLKDKFTFNAALMNERSGETSSNQELEAQRAVVRMVLFPLVLKRGNDDGEEEDEIVVCPAQVLVARDDQRSGRKERDGKRVMSADRMSIDQKSMRSSHSVAPSTLDMGNVI